MASITTRPASAGLWPDVEVATGGGYGGSCWCQWWYLTNADVSTATSERRQELLRDQLEGPPRAIIGYLDEQPAGWCRVAPRVEQIRLAHTQLTKASQIPMDDPAVWAITCLIVRREHRGLGLTHALIDAAIALAREGGARQIKAYPVETGEKRGASNKLFHGTTGMFEAAGFTVQPTPKPGRPIMELSLK